MSAHGCVSNPCTICHPLTGPTFRWTDDAGAVHDGSRWRQARVTGCECPDYWWGITPPPCPVHNPQIGYTWTTITIPAIWGTRAAAPPFRRDVIPQIGWKP